MITVSPIKRHPVTLTIIKAWTTEQIEMAFADEMEDRTCSLRCKDHFCRERLWLIGSWFMHRKTIIECPNCGRLYLTPDIRRKDLETNNE